VRAQVPDARMNEDDVVVMQFAERDLWNVNCDLDALKFDIRGSDDLAPFDCASRSADVP
jgi:hypothetical protein